MRAIKSKNGICTANANATLNGFNGGSGANFNGTPNGSNRNGLSNHTPNGSNFNGSNFNLNGANGSASANATAKAFGGLGGRAKYFVIALLLAVIAITSVGVSKWNIHIQQVYDNKFGYTNTKTATDTTGGESTDPILNRYLTINYTETATDTSGATTSEKTTYYLDTLTTDKNSKSQQTEFTYNANPFKVTVSDGEYGDLATDDDGNYKTDTNGNYVQTNPDASAWSEWAEVGLEFSYTYYKTHDYDTSGSLTEIESPTALESTAYPTDAGKYTCVITAITNANYTNSTKKEAVTAIAQLNKATENPFDSTQTCAAEISFTIKQRAITVTIADKTSVYGDDIVAPTATTTDEVAITDDKTANNGTLSNNLSALITLSAKDTSGNKITSTSNVGTYAINGNSINANYNVTFQGTTTETQSVSFNDFGGETEVQSLSFRLAGTNAEADTTAPLADETTTSTSGTYTITTRTVTITWDETTSFVYDGNAHQPTFELKNLVNGDKCTTAVTASGISTANGQAINVGSYVLTVTLPKTSDGSYNYAWEDETGTNATAPKTKDFTITPLEITVTIEDKSSTYGDAVEKLTATTTNAVANNEGLDKIVSLYTTDSNGTTTTLSTTSNAGSYKIKGNSKNNNYTVTFTEGTYTINKRSITITWGNVSDRTYDGTDKFPTATPKNICRSDTITVTLVKDGTTSTTAQNAGSYKATATFSSNYTTTDDTEKSFTISKRPITVTIADKESIYGDSIIALTAEVTSTLSPAIVSGDSESNIYSLATTATTTSNVGSYAITGTQKTGFPAQNYKITFQNASDASKTTGTYTINKRPVTINWDETFTYTYNGSEQKPNPTFGTNDFIGTDSATVIVTANSGSALTNNQSINAGTYTMTVALPSTNYKWSDTGDSDAKTKEFTITALAITVTIADKTSVYGNTIATLEASTTNTVANTDGINNIVSLYTTDQSDNNVDLSTTSNVGSYKIKGNSKNNNYTVTFQNASDASKAYGTYTVTNATITATVTPYTGVYDSKAHNALTVATTTVNKQMATVNYKLSTESSYTTTLPQITDAGKYTYTVKITAPNHNDLIIEDNKAKITPNTVTVPTLTEAFVYDGTEHTALTGYDTTLVTIGGTDTATNAGNYTATATLKDPTNYTWDDEGKTTVQKSFSWKIEQRKITITADDKDFPYQDMPEGFTYTSTAKLTDGATYDGKNESTVTFTDGNTITVTYTVGTTTHSDTLTITYTVTKSDGTTIEVDNKTPSGTYTITTSAENGNYAFTFNTGKLYITHVEYISAPVIDEETSYTYNGDAQEITFTTDIDARLIVTVTNSGDSIVATTDTSATADTAYGVKITTKSVTTTTTDTTTGEETEVTTTYYVITATNADTYTVTFALPSFGDNGEEYQWQGTTSADDEATRKGNKNCGFTIAKLAIEVTIADKTSVYGDDIVALTATTTDEVAITDDKTANNGTLSNNLSAIIGLLTKDANGNAITSTSNVGTYSIYGECINGNYTVTFKGNATNKTDGIYTITNATITNVAVTPYTGTYDGTAHNVANSVTATTVNDQTITVEYKKSNGTWTSTIPTITTVGSVTFSVRISAKNHNTLTLDETYTANVSKATPTASITIVAEDPRATGLIEHGDTLKVSNLTLIGANNKTIDYASYTMSTKTAEYTGTSATATQTITFKITPKDTTNYNIITVDVNITVTAVAKSGTTYYGTIESALNTVISGEIYVLVGKNPLIRSDCEIRLGVTLCLPLDDPLDDNGTWNKTGNNGVNGSHYFAKNHSYGNTSLLKATAVLSAGKTLTNNGTLNIGGTVTGGNGGANAGFTCGNYSQLTLGENAKVDSPKGSITCYGYIVEDSLNNGSSVVMGNARWATPTITLPFVVIEHRGGTAFCGLADNSTDLTSGKINATPFNRFLLPNVTAELTINYGAKLEGFADLYASSSHNTTIVKLIGASDDYLLNIASGTKIVSKYNPATNVTDLNVKGTTTINSLTLKVSSATLSTADVYFPLSWYYNITLSKFENGSNTTITATTQALKILPGCVVTINEGVTANMKTVFVTQDTSWIEGSGTGATSYDGNGTESQKAPGKLIVNGTLNVENINGVITTQSTSATLKITGSVNATSKEVKEASSNTYYFLKTIYVLSYTELGTNELARGLIWTSATTSTENSNFSIGTYKSCNNYYWISSDQAKTVTFDYTDGTGTKYQTTVMLSNGSYTLIDSDFPTAPTREYYTFGGWFTGKDGTGTQISTGYSISADITLYAKWTLDTNTITYTITLDSSREDVILDSTLVVFGTKEKVATFIPSVNATWNSDGSTTAVLSKTWLNDDINFDSYFIGWTLAYTLNGSTINKYYDDGASITIPTQASNLTLTAQWNKKVAVTIAESEGIKGTGTFYVDPTKTSFDLTSTGVTGIAKDDYYRYMITGFTCTSHTVDIVQITAATLYFNNIDSNANIQVIANTKKQCALYISASGGIVTVTIEGEQYQNEGNYTDKLCGYFDEGTTFYINSINYSNSNALSCTVKETESSSAIDAKTNVTYTISNSRFEIKISSSSDTCLIEGTLITLADGSKKKVEDFKPNDLILSVDHVTGKLVTSKVIIVIKTYASFIKTTFVFDDGTRLTAINSHGLYDVTINKYVNLSHENAKYYIGHDFVSIDSNGYVSTKKFVGFDSVCTEGYKYDIVADTTLNYVAEDLLSVTHVLVDIINTFDFGSNLTYDHDKMVADVEKYGLYTYDDWSWLIDEDVFYQYNFAIAKVGVAKGLYTEEYIEYLVRTYVLDDSVQIKDDSAQANESPPADTGGDAESSAGSGGASLGQNLPEPPTASETTTTLPPGAITTTSEDDKEE